MRNKIAIFGTMLLILSSLGLTAQNKFQLSLGTSIGLANIRNNSPSFSYFGTYENWFLDVPLMVAFSPFQNKIKKRYSIRMAVGPNFLFNLKRLQTLTPLTNTVNPIRETEYNRLKLQTGAVFSLGLNREIGDRYGIAIEILGKVYDFYDAEHYFGANLGGWVSF
ncbi:MAG TPA: hypothetical protein VJ953_16605 [Saprospiraceae bacterium]|nr:hypothetical protein [Saprospiraceae bacterium]